MHLRRYMTALFSTLLAIAVPGGAWAQASHENLAPDWWACVEAAEQVGTEIGAPDHLLTAVALNETGRRSPNGQLAPWPWTINVGGQGYEFATKAQAVFAAQQLLNSGTRSFDVGCMQVNVRFHPRAFTSLEEAFDPLSNMLYAADYLGRLQRRHGSWERAVELYHSYTEEYNQIYGARFATFWDLAQRRAARGDILMTARPAEPASDQAAQIELDGYDHSDDMRDYTALAGRRAARIDGETGFGTASVEATPMVAALLASYENQIPARPMMMHAGLNVRTPAIVRRFNLSASDNTES